MAKNKNQGSTFEIIVVLAIVLIVAVTGQVLISYDQKSASRASSGNGMTGSVVDESSGTSFEVVEHQFTDLSVKSIEVNPPSPLLRQSFEVSIILANEGKATITTPFYVKLRLIPSGNAKTIEFNAAVGKILAPGEETTAVFNIAMISSEGPVKIIATADSTAKIQDDNPSNNDRSKTIIITSQ
jgi:hypothetical protein